MSNQININIGPKRGFFDLEQMKQPVNQWLCIAFLGVFCFWTVLFYFTEKTQAVAEEITSSYSGHYDASKIQNKKTIN